MILRTLGLCLALMTASPVAQEAARFDVTAGDSGVSESSIGLAGRLVGEGLERLEPMFPRSGQRRFRVVLHATEASMPRHIRAAHHPRSPGLALLEKSEIHLILSLMGLSPPGDLRSVVDHELVHILLHEQAGEAGPGVPRWFHEGLAQELAGGAWNGFQEEDLVYRVATDSLLHFGDLRRDFPRDRVDLAYGQSWSFTAFLVREYGLPKLLAIMDRMAPDVDFRAAFYRELEKGRFELEEQWHSYLIWDSGAGARSLYRNCFSFLMILAIPLLGIAVVRRLQREKVIAARLAAEDRPPELHGPPWPPPTPPE